ncbi:hypothetical protein J7K03_01915 [bacterium]|nr:hypothetical protein [bacterium]
MLHFLFYSYLFKHFPKYKKSRYSYAVWVFSEAFNEAVMKEKEWRKIFPSLPLSIQRHTR